MTPAGKITAAIERLEQLKNDSTPGPWWSTVAEVYSGTGLSDDIGVAFDFRYSTDAALTATLHRTIDAQLAILRDEQRALRVAACSCRKPWTPAVALADAILGES